MAIVAGVKSTLNPKAPLFIPVAFRQVEDFSPEWWELVKTSSWFRDYWLSEHPEESFAGDDDSGDIGDLLSESFELRLDDDEEDFLEQFEEFATDLVNEEKTESGSGTGSKKERKHPNGLEVDSKALIKNMSIAVSQGGRAGYPKYMEKPAKYNPKCSPRRIQQPRLRNSRHLT